MKKEAIALTIAIVATVIGISFLLWGTIRPEKAEEDLTRNKAVQANAKSIINNIYYLKDVQTGLCFAYFYFKGPSLVTVPCEEIPDSLLVIVTR